MNEVITARIRENPKYRELIARRGRYAWTLAGIVLVIFYGFAMTVAFSPATLGQPLAEGGFLTKGIVFIFFMFVFFWVLTAMYVRRANTEFDALTAELIAEAWKDEKK
ncbi:MAG: DUF485 domain-containing protein [Rhodocyclaceae bacterium]|nr:DUF485 domain-containing protein [Rhodocyclaceae bacterium]